MNGDTVNGTWASSGWGSEHRSASIRCSGSETDYHYTLGGQLLQKAPRVITERSIGAAQSHTVCRDLFDVWMEVVVHFSSRRTVWLDSGPPGLGCLARSPPVYELLGINEAAVTRFGLLPRQYFFPSISCFFISTVLNCEHSLRSCPSPVLCIP